MRLSLVQNFKKSPKIFASFGFYILIPYLMPFLIFLVSNDFADADLVHADFSQIQKMREPWTGFI
jgi:hypothetical protein